MPRAETKQQEGIRMSGQHTAGPWRVEEWRYAVPGREHVPTIQNDHDAVAEAMPLWGENREAERLANAQLIAAAPAMLAALADIAHTIEDDPEDWQEALRIANAAIAAATGEGK